MSFNTDKLTNVYEMPVPFGSNSGTFGGPDNVISLTTERIQEISEMTYGDEYDDGHLTQYTTQQVIKQPLTEEQIIEEEVKNFNPKDYMDYE